MRRTQIIMKQIVKLLSLLCRKAHLPAIALMALFTGLAAHADVVINETTFPDENFRNFILSQPYGTDGVLTDAEIAAVKAINISKVTLVTSLKGIEYFTALEVLRCENTSLTSLDLSQNTALRYLYCMNTYLNSLDVSKNTELEYLNLYRNYIGALDVTNNKKLYFLQCGVNRLNSLDVSQNTELKALACGGCLLTELDVTNNKKLTKLECGGNNLTSINISQNTELDTLTVHNNQLTELNIRNNKKLTLLHCYDNKLTDLDLSQNPLLTYLQYFGQSRELTAESGITPDGERFYYLRLDDNNDNDKSIWTRMTETNVGGVESKFDPSLVLEWTSGGAVVDGQKRVATTAGTLNPKDVKGKILLLTDVTEDPTTKTASGTVKYKYNVNNSVTPEGETEFTLNWTAPFYGSTHEASSLALNENLLRLQLAQSYQLKVETPNAGEITWTSSNPQAVQVDNTGRVTALKNGTAIITATAANGDYNWCAVWSYLRGDLNEDNKVDVADMNEELNIMLTQ